MRWSYTFGRGNVTPGPGEMYQRTSNRRVRFNKIDFDGQDATELLTSLFDYDRVGYNAEELWEIQKNGIDDQGSYIEYKMNDLMSDTEDSFLPAEVYEFEFFPMGDRDTGEKRRSKLGKNKPPRKEWDETKTKIKGRPNVDAAWVDTVLDNRERSREEQASRMKEALCIGQYNTTGRVSIMGVLLYLKNEGWEVSGNGIWLSVQDQGVTYADIQNYFEACDFSALDNESLASDLCDALKAQGFCQDGCQ